MSLVKLFDIARPSDHERAGNMGRAVDTQRVYLIGPCILSSAGQYTNSTFLNHVLIFPLVC